MSSVASNYKAFEEVLRDFLEIKQQTDGESLQHLAGVLTDWLSAKAEEKDRNAQMGLYFNPLALVSLKETIHSRILGELLDPRGSHGQGTLFLSCLLKHIGIPEPEIGEWSLTVETGRVDMMLERARPRSVILIENKSNGAVDQPNQLYRYWHQQIFRRFPWIDYGDKAKCRYFRVLYLSSDGRQQPEPQSLERPADSSGYSLDHPQMPLPPEAVSIAELMRVIGKAVQEKVPSTNSRLLTFIAMYSELWTT